MQQFAQQHDVTFWEEPVFEADRDPTLQLIRCGRTGVMVATPILPAGRGPEYEEKALRQLLDDYMSGDTRSWIRWYYTPMMLPFSDHVRAACTVYDCMDELTGFRFAPKELSELESAD